MNDEAPQSKFASADTRRAQLADLLRAKVSQSRSVHGVTCGQRSLLFLNQSDPDSPAYNTAFAIRVRSAVDVRRLNSAFEKLVARHAALRTTFSKSKGQPTQTVHGCHSLTVRQVDASGQSWDQLNELVHEDYSQPFDLTEGPLSRVSLYTRNDTDHILLWSFHHIVCDAWSIWVLMRELMEIYAGRNVGIAPKPFHEFVEWQNGMIESPQGAQLWKYWQDKLSDAAPAISLPVDRPLCSAPPSSSLQDQPQNNQSHSENVRGASHFFEIDESLVSRLTGVGKQQGATLFMTLLAAFQTLLHRYSGQQDIIVGAPVAGRNHTDFETTVGFFANTLPIRADFSQDICFNDLQGQVRLSVLDALTHQDLPFPEIVRRLQPTRDASRAPLVQVMFVMQRPPQDDAFSGLIANQPGDQVTWGDWLVEPFQLAQMEGQFEITLEVVERSGSLPCVLKYDPKLYDLDTIKRMESHFQTLLQSIVDAPERPISQLSLCSDQEHNQLLHAWNATHRDYPLDRCLHHWIEDQVERSGDRIALRFEDQTLTWNELNERSNQLARHLQTQGVTCDSPVAVCMHRSIEMVVSLLAILKSGGAYVPLDPDEPDLRLNLVLEDIQSPVLLSHSPLKHLKIKSPNIVWVDDDWDSIRRQPAEKLDVVVQPDDLAYIIFTSGSTGQPKGVANTHRGICNRLLWMQEEYDLDESDKVLQKTPYTFDVSVWEFFWPLMTGAELVIAKPGGHKEGDYLASLIERHAITTIHFVPSMLRVFLETPGVQRVGNSLRQVICSGEALSSDLQQRFFERIDSQLHNLYGPTEAAIDVTYWECVPANHDCENDRGSSERDIVPIGRPIANTQIFILDQHLQPTPIGVPGELHIGGVGLARGYWNRPDLTAEKFITASLATAAHSSEPDDEEIRIYKTGDLCRWLPEGVIEYMGRIDQQVKVRGFRIELEEIEAALVAHPEVREAVVQTDNTPQPNTQLLAWFVPINGKPVDQRQLRSFLNHRLPQYMVPANFVSLESIPLTTSGKVNRKELPVPQRKATSTTKMASCNTARRIAAIWTDLLDIDSVDEDQNFFDAGGHSLLLAQLQIRLFEEFGQAPEMVEMFQHPTVKSLSEFYLGDEAIQRETHKTAAGPTTRISGPTAKRTQGIAIVGMACRFPGAPNIDSFWSNLKDGIESITTFSDEELLAAGVPRQHLSDPSYVKAYGTLSDVEYFDADFFGLSSGEAELMDVQHRLLLETAWTALEHSGHVADSATCGVYAGVGVNTYLLNNVLPNRSRMEASGGYQTMLANDKDFAATRIAYKLNLTGPALNIQTACSTSLVAVHMACQSLLSDDCDIALAGGCSVKSPQIEGYQYEPDMILSPDGHCRAFDAQAAGTVGGSGAGIVVLRRLEDALRDHDTIYAVIRGSATNNDGGAKTGYTAPNVLGQTSVIRKALDAAEVSPDSISYVEAHGTGTPLGDPIELAALAQAFKDRDSSAPDCIIGSVKTNLGHLDAAAGVAGLIKTALALSHRELPASLHFHEPNSKLNLAASQFRVGATFQSWDGHFPRRAGVSSFGIGGTNAHLVLEEAPPINRKESVVGHRAWPIILSAKTPAAVVQRATDLLAYLRQSTESEDRNETSVVDWLGDVARTLASGRRDFACRFAVTAERVDELIEKIEAFVSAPENSVNWAVSSSATAELNDAIRRWAEGETIDWQPFLPENSGRIALPTYPFQRKRLWLDPPSDQESLQKVESKGDALERQEDVKDWFYIPSWRRALETDSRKAEESPTTLVIHDGTTLADATVQHLHKTNHVCQSIHSSELTDRATTDKQIERAQSEAGVFARVIFMSADACSEDCADVLSRLIWLAQSLGDQSNDQSIEIVVVTSGLHHVAGEQSLSPQLAVLMGPVRTIGVEYAHLSCRNIDVASHEWQDGSRAASSCRYLAAQICEEAARNDSESVVALRDGNRWIVDYQKLVLPPKTPSLLKQGGVYLITGGLGAVGLEVASHLAKQYQAKLVLVGRSKFPAQQRWAELVDTSSDHTSKIGKLQEILRQGAEILIQSADVSCIDQLREVRRRAEETFGTVDGVIHAAGVAGGGLIHLRCETAGRQIMAAKVAGTQNLAQEFSDADFLLLFSSIAAVLEEPGQSDYVSANAFMDTFAEQSARVCSINWDTWSETGMAAAAKLPEELRASHRKRLSLGIRSEEGISAMLRVMASGQRRAIVSACDFMQRKLQMSKATDVGSQPSCTTQSSVLIDADNVADDEIEAKLLEIWRAVLGSSDVGLDDDFFQIGGHSLMAVQMAGKVRKALGVPVSLTTVFESPTIRGLAEHILVQQLTEMDQGELDDILADEELA